MLPYCKRNDVFLDLLCVCGFVIVQLDGWAPDAKHRACAAQDSVRPLPAHRGTSQVAFSKERHRLLIQ